MRVRAEVVFDAKPQRFRQVVTGRFVKVYTFRCRFCGEKKPISEMRILRGYFPQLTACWACEERI